MLPPAHRLRRPSDFRTTVRQGLRAGSSTMVVHMLPGSDEPGSVVVPRFGFVVSRAVGNAVQRNLVKRRLRASAREHLDACPSRARVVVRALPGAAAADYAELDRDLARNLARASSRVDARQSTATVAGEGR